MATCFNAGQSKLNKWYTSTDDSPVYKAAMVLYPGFKWEYIEKVQEEHPRWITKAKTNVK